MQDEINKIADWIGSNKLSLNQLKQNLSCLDHQTKKLKLTLQFR
jgi:hypothetical protein